MTEEEDGGTDNPPDGAADYRITYSYDEQNNLVTREADIGADGTVEERNTWTYDADGNLLSWEVDSDGDGTPDWQVAYDGPCPPAVHHCFPSHDWMVYCRER